MSQVAQGTEHDFTEQGYVEIIEAAARSYQFVGFDEPSRTGNIVFFRHDCDASLNRALALARLEAERAVRATYFINPHSLFYNVLERDQLDLVLQILDLGHDLGLHFDCDFYRLRREAELDALIEGEANWLTDWTRVTPKVVSFHNPDAFALTCEQETYGGLVNTYSKSFKTAVTYCSDSNGYWRHARILDVVSKDPSGPIQVLTHPEWWQKTSMTPRSRVLRSVAGRSDAAMRYYDDVLRASGRENLSEDAGALRALASRFPDAVAQIEKLWAAGDLELAYLSLRRLQARTQGVGGSSDIEQQILGGTSVDPKTLARAMGDVCRRLGDEGVQ